MKKRAFIITACVLVVFAVGAVLLKGGSSGLQQGDYNMQYFFDAKVIETHEEYLLLEVIDTGNTNLSEGAKVEVSTDVAAAGCPEFVADEFARVLMARNKDDNSPGRLEALSIYKIDETGKPIEQGI